jgi:hypothetical protein
MNGAEKRLYCRPNESSLAARKMEAVPPGAVPRQIAIWAQSGSDVSTQGPKLQQFLTGEGLTGEPLAEVQ